MRRASLLETQVRRETGNERTGTTDAISSEDFLQYFTDGQIMLYRRMLAKHAKALKAELTFDATGAESYSLPSDIFSQSAISLEYSITGNARDYRPIAKRTLKERVSISGSPDFYIPDGSNILVNPYPISGSFRLNYNRALPRIDKRRATVSSFTKSSTALTALTLSGYTASDYDLFDHLTIVDFDGVVKMRGIPYTAVNSSTGVVSIYNSSYTFPDGSTIANGDYVCLGENASSHVQLPDFCEDFILKYCAKRVLNRDSSADVVDTDPEVLRMATEIIDLWANMFADVDEVPILDTEFTLEW